MAWWKPGDVGSIDSRARFDDSRVMFTGYNWVSASGELLNRFLVPRPLVVIDPDSAEDCERLAKAWSGLRYAELGDTPFVLLMLVVWLAAWIVPGRAWLERRRATPPATR